MNALRRLWSRLTDPGPRAPYPDPFRDPDLDDHDRRHPMPKERDR